MKATTAQTLKLISLLGRVEFRPMTRNDFAAFADAAPDAQIAFDNGDLEPLVAELAGVQIDAGSLAIIVSEGHIEMTGCDPEGDPFAIAFDLASLI